MKTLLALLLFASFASAESIHVTSVRLWQPTDAPRVSRVGETFIISGTLDGKTYSLQQLKTWGTHVVQVGQDYPVVKLSGRTLYVTVTDKKGKTYKENLDVTGVSESSESSASLKPSASE